MGKNEIVRINRDASYDDIDGVKITTGSTHCQACSTNQNRTMNKGQSDYPVITKTMTTIPSWTVLLLIWTSLFVGVSQGLQCYECLSLYCDSGAVCDAIKSTMFDIFVPKRHFIHFDPKDICPEDELAGNSTRWSNLSRECERSDSLCLVSPIEVHTVVEGKKNGKRLEKEYTLMTHGYLRGCANRRKLLEFTETINVRVQFIGRNESGRGSSNGNNIINNNHIPRSDDLTGGMSSSDQAVESSGKKKADFFYNATSMGSAAEFDPIKKAYKDGYTISKIYSHVFYIDQGTENATRCYEDNCNDKIKFKRSGTSGIVKFSNNMFYIALLSALVTFQFKSWFAF